MIIRLTFVLFFLMFCIGICLSQGMHITAGTVLGNTTFEGLSSDGTNSHKGYRIGVDGRLMGDSMYFLAGAHYMKFDMNPNSQTTLTTHNQSIEEIFGRFGLGFTFLETRKFKLRGKALGGVHYVYSTTDNIQVPSPFSDVNEAFGGAIVGLGVDVLFFTLDVEYEKGLVNAINMASESKFDFLYFTVGLFF